MVTVGLALLVSTQCWLQAQSLGKLVGTVIDSATQLPIQGAIVTAGPKGQTSKDTRTDASGQYTIDGIGEGRVYVSIVGKGYLRPQPRSVPVNLRAGETVRQDFELTPAPGVSGAIVDADTGEPLAGCRVSALRKIVSGGEVYFARVYHAVDVDKNGEFRVEGVDPGEYSIEITAGLSTRARGGPANKKRCHSVTYFPESRDPEIRETVTVSDAGYTSLTIRIKAPKLHSISGSISTPDGTHFRWFEIALSRIGRNGERYLVASEQAEGPSFHLDGLVAGDYYLTVTPPHPLRPIFAPPWNKATTPLPQDVLFYERRIEIREDVRDIDVRLEVRSAVPVAGDVRMENGSPAPMIQMMLYGVNGEGEVRSNLAHGPHEVPVNPGEYWPDLRGLPQGYAVSEILAEGTKLVEPLRVETAPRSLTFVVTSGLGTLAGTISGGSTLILFQEPIGERVNGVLLRSIHPDQEGGFTSPGLPAGKYRAVVLTEEEGPLYRDSVYLRKRAVVAPQVEIKAGATTKVALRR